MKNFSRILFTSLFLFCFTAILFSNEQPRGINLTKENGGYKVDFTLPDYYMNNLTAANVNFLNLNIPEYGETPNVGLPNLPQLSFSIMIAYDEKLPGITVLNQVQDMKTLDYKIYPVQQGWSKNLKLEDRPFTIDSKYYQGTGNFNGPFVKVSEPFIIAGVKGVMITVCPFAYNPSTNQIKITKTGSFKVNLSGEPSVKYAPTKSFNELYGAMFVNYNTTKATSTGRYLIITAPEYESSLTPLVNEKTGMGYVVTVVNTNTTGTSNTAIKSYLQSQYDNISTRPEFVLLVGDVDKIPGWTGTGTPDNPPTDLNYSCLEGSDPYADVFLGRFPVANTTQLSNMITKTLYMENAINSLPKKQVFCSSNDNYAITEATHNFCIDSFFVAPAYTNIKLFCHTYSATTQQLTDALNANQSFAIYSGHGSETSWADGPPFNAGNVNALTNTVFPYTYSFACLTGNYQYSSECYAETWVRGAKGAVVYWGSSVTSYWDQDDILQKRLFRAMFVEHLIKTSPSFVLGKYLLTQYYGGPTGTYMQRYLEEYNCMGDPSIYMATYGPAIAHTPLGNTENLSGPYTANCVITPAGQPIVSGQTKLFWTRGTTFTDSIVMTNTSGNNYTANIPGNNATATYRYYIKTVDNAGLSGTAPGGAPTNYYTFTASPDNIKPVINTTPITNTPKQVWPTTVTATVTDNIGIDSVWVRWYKNTVSNYKQFKLSLSGVNNYSALFNSVNSDVVPGDTIKYRIIAQDMSAAHNRDSSALYAFAITNMTSNNIVRNSWIPIRDNVSNYDSFQVSTHSNIIKVNFTMNQLIHTYDGDVTFALRSPNGTEVILSANNGGSGDNYINTVFNDSATTPIASGTAPFTGTFIPQSALSAFNNQDAYGWWRFRVTDDASSDTGHVAQYTVQIVSGATLTGISGNYSLPNSYSLSQNFPNPFNPVTKINFAIPKQGFVSLKIYDILGREVRTLVNDVKSPGEYSVEFNGMEFSSGVYFYRLESNGFYDIKRMLLIK